NMHKFDLSLNELHKMITNAETNPGKTKSSISSVLVVQHKQKFKKKKFNGKAKGFAKPKVTKNVAQAGNRKEDKCHYCGILGHWKSTCKKFLEDRKNGVIVNQPSGMYMNIHVYLKFA
ncbi:hypothetical protein, partial [Mycobacterium tuberculosis]